MANQVIVTNTGNVQVALTPPPNVQVQISRAAIGTISNVPTANFANYAANVTSSSQPNITSLGTLTALNVSGNGTVNNLTVTGNLSVGNLFANNANYSNFAGQVVDATQSNITAVGTLSSLSVSGNISTPTLFSQGMVVQGYDFVQMQYSNGVALPVTPYDIGTGSWFYLDPGGAVWQSNTTGTLQTVTMDNNGNVSATGNITGVNANLGNLVTANYFSGDGSLLSNINLDNINNGTSNVSIPVANSNVEVYANNQNWTFTDVGNLLLAGGNGVIQSIANSSLDPINPNVSTMVLTPDQGNSSQALVLDPTTPGHIHLRAPGSNIDQPQANVYLGGEISSFEVGVFNGAVPNLFIHSNNKTWTFDIDGNLTLPANTFAINYANGTQVPLDGPVANANYANFAGTAYSVDGANVNGEVANANYSSYANIAASANSVALANVSGIGNIANINLDGSSSNVLFGNGVFAPESTSIANANYANFAGTVVNASQSNITSLGNLTGLTINNTVGTAPTLIFAPNGTSFTTNYAPSAGTTQLGQSSRSGTGTPANAIIRTRGTISSPLTVGTSDTVNLNTYYAYNGNTNALAASYTIRLGGSGTLNTGANAVYTGASHTWQTGNPWGDWSNLSAVSGLNTLTFNTQGSLSISQGARRTTGASTGLLSLTDYGTSSGAQFASGIFQIKSRGNADGALSVEPNDEVGTQSFNPTNGNATATISSQIVVKVDSSYTANSAYVPMNILLQPTTNTNTRSTTAFYGNGQVDFSGNIVSSNANLGNLVVANFFSGDGGLLSNINGSNVSNVANANYANFAGTVITNAQPNITSVGNLPYLQVSNSANATGVVNQLSSGNIAFTTNFTNVVSNKITTFYHPNASTGYPGERIVRSRGNVTTPTTAVSGDRISQKGYYAYNGTTNPVAVIETIQATGTVNANANAAYTGGQWTLNTGNPQGNTANISQVSGQNGLTFSNSGTLNIIPGTAPNTSLGQSESGIFLQSWGLNTTDPAGVGGINSQKARGSRDGALSVQAGDQLGRWNAWGHNGSNYQTGNVASLTAIVSSDYVANASIIPIDMQIRAVSNTAAAKFTNFYGNGTASFPGDISATSGNITGANVVVNTSGFMKLASYTATALNAITGSIGWMAAVSDSAQGSNPNGMIAFWDTTNSRWSYIHDNSAV